jgi:hypothetical protein
LDSQKLKHIELSEGFLLILESQKRRAWHDIVMRDKSWFDCRTGRELIWLHPGEEVPDRE